MLVTIKKTVEHNETREIKLPFHSCDTGTYYRINEDGSILKIYNCDGFAFMSVIKLSNGLYQNAINEAAEAKPCEALEMEEALMKTIETMDKMIERV